MYFAEMELLIDGPRINVSDLTYPPIERTTDVSDLGIVITTTFGGDEPRNRAERRALQFGRRARNH